MVDERGLRATARVYGISHGAVRQLVQRVVNATDELSAVRSMSLRVRIRSDVTDDEGEADHH